MSKRSVREAFETSVAWRPVSLKTSHESIVPKTASSAPSAFCKEPLDLRAGEVRVENEPGALAHQVLVAGLAELVAASRRAAVLPDERVVDGLAGLGVPRDDRLALVRDPDRVERRALRPGVL